MNTRILVLRERLDTQYQISVNSIGDFGDWLHLDTDEVNYIGDWLHLFSEEILGFNTNLNFFHLIIKGIVRNS